MNNNDFLNMMKNIQSRLLAFIEQEEKAEENFEQLHKLINDRFKECKYSINSLLHLLTEIGNNHHRSNNFFSKIEKIILIIKDQIKQNFSQSEIFNIFRSNKRLLLFAIKEKLIIMDKSIAQKIMTEINKSIYFLPEIKPFLSEINNTKNNENDKDMKMLTENL